MNVLCLNMGTGWPFRKTENRIEDFLFSRMKNGLNRPVLVWQVLEVSKTLETTMSFRFFVDFHLVVYSQERMYLVPFVTFITLSCLYSLTTLFIAADSF